MTESGLYMINEIIAHYPNISINLDDENIDKNEGACTDDTICMGEYDDENNLLISLFHEIGHILNPKRNKIDLKYNKEKRAWKSGLREAKKFGIVFPFSAYRYAISRLRTYLGWEEREIRNWEEVKQRKEWRHVFE